MDTKKFIKRYKIIFGIILSIFIVAIALAVLLQEDVFEIFFPNAKFKGVTLNGSIGIAFFSTIFYIATYSKISSKVPYILQELCLPNEYREVYLALSPKKNKTGALLVNNATDFMLGNFDPVKIRCLDILMDKTASITLVNHAYLTLAQIYFVMDDLNNLVTIEKTISIRLNECKNERFKKIYEHIDTTYKSLIEFLNGDTEPLRNVYSEVKDTLKHKSDRSLANYYYAITLIKNGEAELAIPILEKLITDVPKLFVSKFAQMILIQIVVQ